MAESAHEMQIAMKRLLETGEDADLTLTCRGHTWKVHSSYLWPRSSWFRAACKGGFSESETQRIDLPEEEPSMIHRMLQHLYLQAYAVNLGSDAFWLSNDSWAKSRLQVHAQMYSLGDKYDLPALKKEAARRFEEDVETPGETKRETTLTLLSVVPLIYSTTPDTDAGLRDPVVRQIYRRYNTASKHFVDELDTALEVRQFARDVIVFHRTRPTVRFAALARKADRVWRRHIRPLFTATMSSFPTVAALSARMLAVCLMLLRSFCCLIVVLVVTSLLKGHLSIVLERLEQRPRSSRCWLRPE